MATTKLAIATRPIQLEASIACANFAALETDLRQLSESGVDCVHIDLMDGRFVDNFGLDFSIMETISRIVDLPLDCHLMIEAPERFIDRTARAGAKYITIHYEATHHVQKALRQIRDAGAKPGIALNPATPVACLDYILDDVDVVTVMTVNPGAAGQSLIPSMLRKIGDVRQLLEASGHGNVDIQVDGNVSFEHIPAMVAAGATMLVGGTSSIFHRGFSIPDAIHAVRKLVDETGRAQ
jgi:ribulose-phosphate 3-epimerase